MEEWKEYKAKDFCTSVTDGTHDSPKPKSFGHYLITSKHLKDNRIDYSTANLISEEDYQKVIQRSAVEQYDILFSMIGTIGNVVQVKLEQVDFAVKNMGIFKMGKEPLKSYWLYYWLKSDFSKEYINQRLAGSTQSYLTLDSLRNYPILYPGDHLANKIISILKSLDDKIENNRKINENLEQQAQALFKSWFVDFEPFRDQPFVESELGMIPEGWRVDNFGSLFDIKYGKDHKKLDDGIFPVYGSGGLMRMVNKSLYQGESVLIPRKGSLNNVMYVNESFWTVDTMFYTIPKIEYVVIFAFILLRNKDLSSMNVGSAVPSMTTEVLNNIKIVLPTDNIMSEFNSLVSTYYREIKHNEAESHRLSQLRDTLLPKLMNGEIKIS